MFHGNHLSDPQTLHQINYFFLNHGYKIHLLSSQSSCVSVFDLEDLRMISCDWACFTVSKTHPTFEIFHFSPEKFTSELGNLKWENGDFVGFSPEFTTLKNSVMTMKT